MIRTDNLQNSIYKTKYKEYIINYEDMIEMIKTYNKLKTISLEDMYAIQHYFLSLTLEISNNKLREKNFHFVHTRNAQSFC